MNIICIYLFIFRLHQHWWKCDGPCSKRPPYYGLVKRSMNRPPGPSDHWYKEHQKNCGGTFHKIKEPEKIKKTNKKKDEKQHKITSFLTDENKKNEKDNNNDIKLKKNNNNNEKNEMEKVLYTSSEDSDFEEYIKNKRKHKSIKELNEKNKK